MAHAHSRGILNRDIKSTNVSVLSGDNESRSATLQVRLIDFGIARAKEALSETKTPYGTVLVGTPAYMSLEQLKGKPFDARSEIYSIGCLLCEMLTGQTPFVGENALEVLKMHSDARVVPVSELRPEANFNPLLDGIVLRCLGKSPDDRYADMSDLAKTLETHMIEELGTSSTTIDAVEAKDNSISLQSLPMGMRSTSESTAILAGMLVLSFGFIILLFRLQSVSYDTRGSARISKTSIEKLDAERHPLPVEDSQCPYTGELPISIETPSPGAWSFTTQNIKRSEQ